MASGNQHKHPLNKYRHADDDAPRDIREKSGTSKTTLSRSRPSLAPVTTDQKEVSASRVSEKYRHADDDAPRDIREKSGTSKTTLSRSRPSLAPVTTDQKEVSALRVSEKNRPADDNGNHPPAVPQFTFDSAMFSRRLQTLYQLWRKNKADLWRSSTAFVIATAHISDIRDSKSSSLHLWLLGVIFPDTVIVFSEKKIRFLCSQSKARLLDVVKKPAKVAVGVDVVIYVKGKNEDGSYQMDTVLRDAESEGTRVLGYISGEAPSGKFLLGWMDKLRSSCMKVVDIGWGLQDLFACKDDSELAYIKKSGYLTASAMKVHVVPKLAKVIDDNLKITHVSLMDDTEKAILKPSTINVRLNPDNVNVSYPPVFQSGGKFDLTHNASSNHDNLCFEPSNVIICALGSKYKAYYTNVARTFLVDPVVTQTKAYEVLLKAHEAAICALKPGNKASDVYIAAYSAVKKEAPDLILNLTESAGTGIGLEFCESGWILNERNERKLKAGMVFNISVGFQNLQAKSRKDKSQNYALLLADTVILYTNGCQSVTRVSSKALEDVKYYFKHGEDKDEMTQAKRDEAPLSKTTGDSSCSRSSEDFLAYKNVNDLPPPRESIIIVDEKNESILILIYGCMVPFHISTVYTVSSYTGIAGNYYIRIAFRIPGTPFSAFNNVNDIFLQDVSFRLKDPRQCSEVVERIITLLTTFLSREDVRLGKGSLVSPKKVPIRLTDEGSEEERKRRKINGKSRASPRSSAPKRTKLSKAGRGTSFESDQGSSGPQEQPMQQANNASFGSMAPNTQGAHAQLPPPPPADGNHRGRR